METADPNSVSDGNGKMQKVDQWRTAIIISITIIFSVTVVGAVLISVLAPDSGFQVIVQLVTALSLFVPLLLGLLKLQQVETIVNSKSTQMEKKIDKLEGIISEERLSRAAELTVLRDRVSDLRVEKAEIKSTVSPSVAPIPSDIPTEVVIVQGDTQPVPVKMIKQSGDAAK